MYTFWASIAASAAAFYPISPVAAALMLPTQARARARVCVCPRLLPAPAQTACSRRHGRWLLLPSCSVLAVRAHYTPLPAIPNPGSAPWFRILVLQVWVTIATKLNWDIVQLNLKP